MKLPGCWLPAQANAQQNWTPSTAKLHYYDAIVSLSNRDFL